MEAFIEVGREVGSKKKEYDEVRLCGKGRDMVVA